jgi:hypothetical protein
METRLSTTRGTLRLLVAAIFAVTLTMAQTIPASAGSPTDCRVRNTVTGKTYTAPQAAVDAAKRGDRLTVRGTCRGRTIIDRSIVIVGVPEADPRRPPTLTGGNKAWVIVLRKALKVRIGGLRIQGTEDPCYAGQGIRNLGNLTLSDVEVRRLYGGIANEGRLRLIGAASVEDNCRSGVVNHGVMAMRDTSRVVRNAQGLPPTMVHGALAFHNTGTLTMDGSSRISHNGEVLYNNGSMTMNGTSVISHNPVANNRQGVLTLNDSSSIRSNHLPAAECGSRSGSAGLACPWESCAGVENAGTLTLNDTSSIRDNSAGGNGGGVCNSGSLTLNDSSSINGNSAGGRGGGVQMNRYAASPPSLTMAGNSAIVGNSASEGGGIWYSVANATLGSVTCGPDGNVYGNTPDDCHVEP